MHFFQAGFIAVLAAAASAMPMPEEPPPESCTSTTSYNITSQSPSPVIGSQSSVVAMTCDGSGGDCTLGTSYSYSVSTTISVGISLNLDPEEIQGNAGLTAGYTHTTTKGTSDSASIKCPAGPWDCGIAVTPWVAKVSGFQYKEEIGPCGSSTGKISDANPYTIEFPQTTNNLPQVNAAICACPNGPSPTASGAPPACPSAC